MTDIFKTFCISWGIKEEDMQLPEVKAFFEHISTYISYATLENYKTVRVLFEDAKRRGVDVEKEAQELLNEMFNRILPAHQDDLLAWLTEERIAGRLSSLALPGESKVVPKTVRVRFHLSARTRMVFDYDKEVEVKEGERLSEARLHELAKEAYNNVEAAEFEHDYDYWERGECWAEIVRD